MDYNMEEKYTILKFTELSKIDFSNVIEDHANTLVYSNDIQYTFISWYEEPEFVKDLETKEGPYSRDEMLSILQTANWNKKPKGIIYE